MYHTLYLFLLTTIKIVDGLFSVVRQNSACACDDYKQPSSVSSSLKMEMRVGVQVDLGKADTTQFLAV